MNSTDPFCQEGMADYWNGLDISECPYSEGTDGQHGWLKGWNAAANMDDNKEGA